MVLGACRSSKYVKKGPGLGLFSRQIRFAIALRIGHNPLNSIVFLAKSVPVSSLLVLKCKNIPMVFRGENWERGGLLYYDPLSKS